MSEQTHTEPTLKGSISVITGGAFASESFDALDGMPLIRIRDLGKTETEIKYRGAYDPIYLVGRGDILIGMDGDFFVQKWAGGPALLNQRVCKVVALGDAINQSYLYWYLHPHIDAIHRKTPQTTVRHLSTKSVFDIPAPPIPTSEQEFAAKILDTLDTAIHETEALIAKLKAVKQGLLHDLLTRGIDANGQLRPPQSEAPHLYKQSPLGWIPKEWEPSGVLDVAPNERQCILTGPFGAELGQADFKAEGIPVLRIGNVQAGFIDWADTQFVMPEKANSLEKYRVQEGDLLFARQGATTGRNALADVAANGALINYHIIRVAVDRHKCHPLFLYAAFNSSGAKAQVDQAKGRGTREGINSQQIASLRFALPPPEEQKAIVARIISIDTTIGAETQSLDKARREKAALMNDLLTGRVRVTPLLTNPETAHA